jgi:hypothetical protein
MITILLTVVGFIGGLYVGARWAEKFREVYKSLIG